MKALLFLGFIFFSMTVHGKGMKKCEFARLAKEHGLSGYNGVSLENWVCTAFAESRFNTKATHYNPDDQSTDYGPWQVNSHYWCEDGKTPNASNECKVQCSELLKNDISKSVKCIKHIVKKQGMEAWVGWKNECQGKDLSNYLKKCHL